MLDKLQSVKQFILDELCNCLIETRDANDFYGSDKKLRDVDFKGFLEFIDGRLAKSYAAAKGIEDQAEAAAQIKDKIENSTPKLHGATLKNRKSATMYSSKFTYFRMHIPLYYTTVKSGSQNV
ncbi:hypothetical protein ACTXT7_012210 [Hymenolepis weldensis]